jgi:MtaA/CmuA family methyltransferase
MSNFSPKERLLKILHKEETDRPPVICPGGMMNAAIVEVMSRGGHVLPAAHIDDKLMAELAVDIFTNTGFENLGIPFCMTVEPEVLGSTVDYGSLTCEPKIAQEVFSSSSAVDFREFTAMLQAGRINTVVQATYNVARRFPDIPVIGNITGPVSTAASIVDPMTFLKELRRNKLDAHRVMEYVSDFLIVYATLMIDNGANVISIADPTATGEILGPHMFSEYPLVYINKIIEAVHLQGVPVIVHVCGNINAVKHVLPELKADAISADAMVNLRQLKEEFPQLVTMGNVSTYLLEMGTPDKVANNTRHLLQEGIDIIAPACGLSTSTRLDNIQAMSGTVKEK